MEIQQLNNLSSREEQKLSFCRQDLNTAAAKDIPVINTLFCEKLSNTDLIPLPHDTVTC